MRELASNVTFGFTIKSAFTRALGIGLRRRSTKREDTEQVIRKGALLDSGTPSPNPWDLSLSRQNDCFTLRALARKIRLRRDATRAPMQGPEWQGAASPAALKLKPKTPSSLSLLPTNNGLDNGVHCKPQKSPRPASSQVAPSCSR